MLFSFAAKSTLKRQLLTTHTRDEPIKCDILCILCIVFRMVRDMCLLPSNVCYVDNGLLNVSILKRIRALTRYTLDLCGLGSRP